MLQQCLGRQVLQEAGAAGQAAGGGPLLPPLPPPSPPPSRPWDPALLKVQLGAVRIQLHAGSVG